MIDDGERGNRIFKTQLGGKGNKIRGIIEREQVWLSYDRNRIPALDLRTLDTLESSSRVHTKVRKASSLTTGWRFENI